MIDVDQFRRNADYVERMGALTIRDAQAVKDWRAAADEITELRALALSLADALHVAQKALSMVIDPDSIKVTTVSGAFAAATEAECGARSALSDQRLLKLKGAV